MATNNDETVKCERIGCQRHATHHVKFRVWAVGHPKSSPPLTGEIGLRLCKEHAQELASSKEFMTDEAWAKIVQAVKTHGFLPPDRNSVEAKAVRGFASVSGPESNTTIH